MSTNRGPVAALASASRAAANYDVLIANNECKGILVVADVTVNGGTATLQPVFVVKELAASAESQFLSLTASAATVNKFAWLMYPGSVEGNTSGNTTRFNGQLPANFILRFVVAVATMTFSATYWLLV